MPTDDLTHTHSTRCWWHPEQARWVCASERPLVDVRDMLVVHTAMLREFRLLPDAVRRVPAADPEQAAVIARHLDFVCDLLHHHHEGEDALLWPTLRERVSPHALTTLDEIEDQHGAIDVSLSRVRDLVKAWLPHAGAGERDDLAVELDRLHALLRDHLDLEERAVLPLAALLLAEAEWSAVGEAAVAAMPKSALALSFGMFAYEGDPQVLAAMLSSAPLVPRKLLPMLAPRLYARRARAVYGTTHP